MIGKDINFYGFIESDGNIAVTLKAPNEAQNRYNFAFLKEILFYFYFYFLSGEKGL